jgi:hypothetical protein
MHNVDRMSMRRQLSKLRDVSKLFVFGTEVCDRRDRCDEPLQSGCEHCYFFAEDRDN